MKHKHKPVSPELFSIMQVELAGQFPLLFNLAAPVPLKIGLRKDMRKRFPEMRSVILSGFLMAWCARPEYWAACTEGAARYGFDGEDGVVTAKGAAYAAQRLAEIAQQAKRAA